MVIGDIVYHTWDISEDPLEVIDIFFWLGQRKLQCKNLSDGTYVTDYDYYFRKASS